MVIKDQVAHTYATQGGTPKGRDKIPTQVEQDMEVESRFDDGTIKTQADLTLPEREPAGDFPAWSPALADQNPPTTITAKSAAKKEVNSTRDQATDFMNNDNSFHVVASLLVDKFEETLKTEERFVKLTKEDKEQMNQMLPEGARELFVAALRFRMKDAPEFSRLPLHTVTRNCHKLGLDRLDTQNMLFAPAGTIIRLEFPKAQARATSRRHIDTSDDKSVYSEYEDEKAEDLARQQLLAELKEASTLMAESVTPEAAQFWKKQVVELQSKLRTLHENRGDRSVRSVRSSGRSVASVETAELMRQNERLLSNLKTNTGYVPPSKDNYAATYTPKSHVDEEPKINEGALPEVQVVAPADLPGGYTFEAQIDDKHFLATVPAGGVKKGETFMSVMRDIEQKGLQIPNGRWRDGLLDIFKHGAKHPIVILSVFCPPIALAQIMTRLSLDFRGRPANLPDRGIWSTWGTMISILSMWTFLNGAVIYGWRSKMIANVALSIEDIAAIVIINVAMFVYLIDATANTRTSLRKYSNIEEKPIWFGPKKFANGQDYVLATFAMPFTIAQMGRHTASYQDQKAYFLTSHGLSTNISIADILFCNDPEIFGSYAAMPGNIV